MTTNIATPSRRGEMSGERVTSPYPGAAASQSRNVTSAGSAARSAVWTDAGVSTPQKWSSSRTAIQPSSLSRVCASACSERVADVDPRLDPCDTVRDSALAVCVHAADPAAQPLVRRRRSEQQCRARPASVGRRPSSASGRSVGGCSSCSVLIGVTFNRLIARSTPTNDATKSLAGWPSTSDGASYCSSTAADVEDRDAVTELHRFVDVVRDEHDRLLQRLPAAARTRPAGARA